MANLSVVDLKEHLGQSVELNRSNLLRFAEQLIASPSPNPPGDERLVVATIQRELEALELKDVALVSKSDRRPNLLCRVSGKNGSPVLILNGHTDTKPAGDERRWKTDPFHPTVRRGRLYGLGACDMKGAIAALVYAAAAIDSLPQRLPANLVLVLTADEEADSRYGARYVVEEYGLRGDCGLVCEGSGISRDFEQLCVLSGGFSAFKVKSYGTQIHSSVSDLVPSLNASTMLGRVLFRLDRKLDVRFPAHSLCPQGVTVNLGVRIQGGLGYGTYPGYAEFGVDVRTLAGMSQDGLRLMSRGCWSNSAERTLHPTWSWNSSRRWAGLRGPRCHPIIRWLSVFCWRQKRSLVFGRT